MNLIGLIKLIGHIILVQSLVPVCTLIVSPVANPWHGLQGDCNVNGTGPVPVDLTEPLPEGACVVLVKEDFLDIPLGTEGLLLHSLYVAVAPPPDGEVISSVLLLHVCPSSIPIDTFTPSVSFCHSAVACFITIYGP